MYASSELDLKDGFHYYEELDGLKVFFCIAVTMFHYWLFFPFDIRMPFNFPFLYGYLGVEFFFMVSGFFISGKYRKSIMGGVLNPIVFLRNRVAKLYPDYFIAVVFGIVVSILDIHLTQGLSLSQPVDMYDALLSFGMLTQGYIENSMNPYGVVTWFVNLLILMYIIFCILARISKNENSFYYSAIVLVLIGWACARYALDAIPFLRKVNGRAYLSFGLGILLENIYHRIKKKHLRSARIIIIFIIATFLLFLAKGTMHGNYVFGLGNVDMLVSLFVLPSAILGVLLFPVVGRLFRWRTLLIFSKLTTPIFYFHMSALYLYRVVTSFTGKYFDVMNSMKGYLIFLIVVSICAWIYSITIEKWICKKMTNVLMKL